MNTGGSDKINAIVQNLRSKLRLIALLLFIFPGTVVTAILYQRGLLEGLQSSHFLIFLLILVLACAGITVLRQAFEKFIMVSVYLQRAENGEAVQMDLHHDPTEMGVVAESFNRLVSRIEDANEKMEVLHADLEEANAGRRRAEDSLVALKKAVDIMQLGVTITDIDRMIVYTNAADARMHGYDLDELIGRDARIFAPPEQWGSDCASLESMMSWKREGVNIRKDGSTFPVHLTSDAVTDSVGCCTGIVTTCEDITEKKRAQEELRESRQFLEDIIQFFPDAIMVIDNGGRVVAWNRAMESLTGVVADDMVGKGEYEYSLPFYNERRPMLIDLVLRSDTDVVRKYLSVERRGETLCAETFMPVTERHLQGTAAVLRDCGGEIIGAIESIRDVTKRKQMEEALRSANEFSRVVMDSVDDAISIINVDDFRIEGVNAGFLKQLNLTLDEVIGRKCYEVSHHRCEPCSPPFDPCPMQECVATGKPATAEHIHLLPNGEKLHVEVISSPVCEGNNRVTRVVHVSRDITERKRMEAERERLIEELREALTKVKTLSGMLPICACCKKIRDDKGYWNQLEAYIGQHSEVLFTHSYCPDCLKKVYAELEDMKTNKSAARTGGKAPDDSGT